MLSTAPAGWLCSTIGSFWSEEIHRQRSGGIFESYRNIGRCSDVGLVAGELLTRSVVVGLGRRCSWLCRIPFYGTPVAGLSKSQSSRAGGGCSHESGFCLP